MLSIIIEGLVFATMVLGIYISYRVLDFPDLTTDGSFVLGAAVLSTALTNHVPVLLAIVLASMAGACAGMVTGIIHTRFNITNLLSGILVMIGLYSVNLRVMGKSNVHLFKVDHLFSTGNDLITILVVVGIAKVVLDLFFKTKLGFAVKLIGDNEDLLGTLGLDKHAYKVLGLMIANGLVALSGALLAQYQGFADINMGTGMLVVGLASIIIGEALLKPLRMVKLTTAAILGSIVYRMVLSYALKLGLAPSDLKLLTSLALLGILIVHSKGHAFIRTSKTKKERVYA